MLTIKVGATMSKHTSWLLSAILIVACSKSKNDAVKQAPGTTPPVAGTADKIPATGSAGGSAEGAGVGSAAGSAATLETGNSETGDNYLSLAAGAVLVAQPTSHRAFDNTPINLIFEGLMWRSDDNNVKHQVFTIETPGITTLTKLGFDTNHIFYTTAENAKSIVVEASNTSATDGFQPILTVSLEQEPKIATFPVSAKVPARWFRLTIEDNHGSTEAVALKRVFGYGSQEPGPMPTKMSGMYQLIDSETGNLDGREYEDIFIKQDGTSLIGCWRGSGTLTGGFQNNVATISWTHPDLGKNGGLIVATKQNEFVFWRTKSDSFWALATYRRAGDALGPCGDGSSLTAPTGIAKDLADNGRAVVYGINFDFNSDRLRPESKVVLEQIVAVLVANPAWKLQIEGHTDNIGNSTFNQQLSEKRAAAVLGYLKQQKIAADRLSSSGAGLSRPIASNDNGVGRARNRRVELVKP